MASARYQGIRETGAEYYYDKSPVQIEKCVLLYDTEKERRLFQLKLRNIGREVLQSFYFQYRLLDAAGNMIEEKQTVYKDINCAPGETFGTNRPIVTLSQDAADISLRPGRAVWADGRVTDLSGCTEYRIPAQQELPEAFTAEEIAELGAELDFAGKQVPMRMIPREVNDIWQCFCGSWNRGAFCVNCGTGRQEAMNKCDHEALAAGIAARAGGRTGKTGGKTRKGGSRKKVIVTAAAILLLAALASFLIVGRIISDQKMIEALLKEHHLEVEFDGAEVTGWGKKLKTAAKENHFILKDAWGNAFEFSNKEPENRPEAQSAFLYYNSFGGYIGTGTSDLPSNRWKFMELEDFSAMGNDIYDGGYRGRLSINGILVGDSVDELFAEFPEEKWRVYNSCLDITSSECVFYHQYLGQTMFCTIQVSYNKSPNLITSISIRFSREI